MTDKSEIKREIVKRLSYRGPEEAPADAAAAPEPDQQKEEAPAAAFKREVVRRISYRGPDEAPADGSKPVGDIEGFKTEETFAYATNILAVMLIIIIFLFAFCTKEGIMEADPDTGINDFGFLYEMYLAVEIMMFFGFGYLMCFLKRYGMGAVGFTMLITVLGLLWGILVENFFKQATAGEFDYIELELLTVLDGLFLVAAVLISYGGIIGKVSPLQLIVMTIIEATFYSINKQCLLLGVVDFADAGGSINIHMFGAYFGLAVAWIIGKPGASADSEGGHVADLFSLIGCIFLWIYWPSFNAGALEPNSPQQQRGIINTILAMSAATITTFIVSSRWSYSKKIRPVDIQNATLAGGVAMGAICHLTLRPSDSIIIGVVAGALSTYGYVHIQLWVENTLGIHDTCGINNLHAMPSILGGLASIILAGYKAPQMHDVPAVFYDDEQWVDQILACVFTLAVSISSGLLCGFIMWLMRPREDTEFFGDGPYWEIMDDFGRSVEEVLMELAKSGPEDDANNQREIEMSKA